MVKTLKKRVIPTKNYLIFTVLSICTIALCLYLSIWYKTVDEYYKNNSIIPEVISEIESSSFASYLLDNPEIVVYVTSSKEESIQFERKFKKVIVNNDLGSKILYLDVSKEENEEVLEMLRDNYLSEKYSSLESIPYPNLILFQNGEITGMLYQKQRQIKIDDVMAFLQKREIIND